MPGHGEKLTRKQEQAVAALLTHPTLAQAAQSLGISERKLRDWMSQPEFKAAYRDARRQVVEAAVSDLQKACHYAVATLKRNLVAEKPADQIRAATAILEHSLRGLDVFDLLARVEELESRADG
jgi:hypothetical protein